MAGTVQRGGWRWLVLWAAVGLAACGDEAEEPTLDSPEDIFSHVEALTALGVRMPGTEASVQAAEYVRDRFEQYGLRDVAIETADTIVWSADRWGLAVEGETVPAYRMQHTFHTGEPGPFTTGPGGLDAELVYVGDGTEADFEGVDVAGKIVVANVRFNSFPRSLLENVSLTIHDPEETLGSDFELLDPYTRRTFPANYYNAQERGAVGFIGILNDYLDRNEYHNEGYDAYEPGRAMELPGLWVSPSVGADLVERIESAAGPVTANLVLEGRLEEALGRNVVGYLPGRSDEIIMIQSHHDSTTTGAVEDASGTSLVLALAEYFADVPRAERDRTLLFTTMDTHFTDYACHTRFVERHIETEDIVANVTLEHIANEVIQTPDGIELTGELSLRAMFVTTEVDGFESIALDAVQGHGLGRTVVMPTSFFRSLGIPADSSHFFRAGVPVIVLVGAPIYLYDTIDTLDKVSVPELGRVSGAFVEVVTRMDDLPTEAFRD